MPTDLEETTRHDVLLQRATRTADQSTSGADARNFAGQMLVIDIDSYTDGSHDFALEVSDDGNTWSAPESSQLSGDAAPTVDGGGKTGTYYVSYLGTKRYIRATVTVSGAPSTGATYGVYAIKGNADDVPV